MDCFGFRLSAQLSAAPVWESSGETAEIDVAAGEHPALLGDIGECFFSCCC